MFWRRIGLPEKGETPRAVVAHRRQRGRWGEADLQAKAAPGSASSQAPPNTVPVMGELSSGLTVLQVGIRHPEGTDRARSAW